MDLAAERDFGLELLVGGAIGKMNALRAGLRSTCAMTGAMCCPFMWGRFERFGMLTACVGAAARDGLIPLLRKPFCVVLVAELTDVDGKRAPRESPWCICAGDGPIALPCSSTA